MAGIKYEIEKELGVIAESKKRWNKELNLSRIKHYFKNNTNLK